MLRRPVVIALSLVVLFGLVVCGDDSDSETEGSAVPLADADGLAGTSWVLTEYTDASGDTVPAVAEPASLSFTDGRRRRLHAVQPVQRLVHARRRRPHDRHGGDDTARVQR